MKDRSLQVSVVIPAMGYFQSLLLHLGGRSGNSSERSLHAKRSVDSPHVLDE